MLPLERKQELLAHAKKSLAKWNDLDPKYKSPSQRPYANTIGCEELVELLEELGVTVANTHTLTYKGEIFHLTDDELQGLLPAPVPEEEVETAQGLPVDGRPLVTVSPGAYARRVVELEKEFMLERNPDKRREIQGRLDTM